MFKVCHSLCVVQEIYVHTVWFPLSLLCGKSLSTEGESVDDRWDSKFVNSGESTEKFCTLCKWVYKYAKGKVIALRLSLRSM